ncbi:hypothetical protein [Nonomuraea jabiensis]|uniref:hypothetical protein n=1 Tax=Nonomuraea jabiensis TaxID=882448 RepID=UPI003D70510D
MNLPLRPAKTTEVCHVARTGSAVAGTGSSCELASMDDLGGRRPRGVVLAASDQ